MRWRRRSRLSIAAHADLADEAGRRRVVRHVYQPEREVQTGIGAVAVRRPRVRDRQPDAGRGRIRFTSSILPPYLRRAKSVEELLAWLYLKGISTGDFGEALAALLESDAPGLSATTVIRLKTAWAEEYERWLRRDLSAKRYVYLWADGVYFSPRLEHDKQCLLVIIGADEIGNKDIVGLSDGYRESEQSWCELLLDLKRRGLTASPELATGDGALGFWKAAPGLRPHPRAALLGPQDRQRAQQAAQERTGQRQRPPPGHLDSPDQSGCRERLRLLPPGLQRQVPQGGRMPGQGPRSIADFLRLPAEHWKHVRTSNPIESTFATVRLRTIKTKGCLSRNTALAMVFKLLLSARRKWRRLNGSNHLAEVIQGVTFKDGIKQIQHAA